MSLYFTTLEDKAIAHFMAAMRYISSVLIFTFISSWGSLIRSERSLPHVTDYGVVRPLKLSSRAKRSISSEQTYPEELQYALTIEGKNYTVHLEKNSLLIGKHYTETHYLENGTEVTTSPNYEDHCYYHGYIQDIEDSSVSIGMCSGIRGFMRAEQQVYLIEPLEDSVEGDHAVYRQEHLKSKTGTCGNSNDTFYDYEPMISELYKPLMSESLMSGKTRFVEMFLVVDHSEYRYLGRNIESIKARMLEITNHVDKLYRPLNIRVMLVGLEVWSDQDKIDVSVNANETLTRFLQWRQDSLIKKTKHDNAQFVTAVDFLGDTLGLAPMYGMCTANSGAVSQDGAINPIRIASIITHEMGHNLGMAHDNDLLCDCSASGYQKCIMEPRLGLLYPRKFSSCSKNNLGEFLENSNPSCLLNPQHQTSFSEVLFVGMPSWSRERSVTVGLCGNPCCDATTCRLKKGAKCAEGECCRNCQLKQAGSPCRESANDCDLTEYCTGQSAQCPKDVFKMNGLPCNFDQGYCYNGQCPTYLHHCRKLWGSGAQVASELCFYFNTFNSTNAYCKKTQSGYQRCTVWNRKCGKIFCTGGKPFPITGEMVALINGKCNIAVDSSETEDLGMVPTGTKCGDEKVCYDNICQGVTIYGVGDCSAKCNNRGVCNHERQCHCDPGWAPPYCDVKYDDFSNVKPDVKQDAGGDCSAKCNNHGVCNHEKQCLCDPGWASPYCNVKNDDFNSVTPDVKQDGSRNNNDVVIIGVIIFVITLAVTLACCRKSKKASNTRNRQVIVASNPAFQRDHSEANSRCGPTQINPPTFAESSANLSSALQSATFVPIQPPSQGDR